MLPFTVETFFAVFAKYNENVWPAQVVAYVLAAVALALVIRRARHSGRAVSVILAAFWLWTGIAYHILHFAPINPAAFGFGVAFIAQGVLLFLMGGWRDGLRFGRRIGKGTVFGWFLVGYALVLYPLLGMWAGHVYPEMPSFGITPCPVTLFTVGILLLTTHPVPRVLLVVPLLWSLIGGSAALLLHVPQDWMLLIGGLAGLGAVFVRDAAWRKW